MTNLANKSPEMLPAVMAAVDETVDASHALRDVEMVEVKAVATGVAGVEEQTVVVLSAVSALLAVTVQCRISRASAWTQTVKPCQWQATQL
jgi:hypothetical protein